MKVMCIFVGNKAKRWVSKWVFKKTKHAKFSEKQTFLTHWHGLHIGVRNVLFSENLCFVFLKHPFWDSPFCLITDVFVVYCTQAALIFENNKNGVSFNITPVVILNLCCHCEWKSPLTSFSCNGIICIYPSCL